MTTKTRFFLRPKTWDLFAEECAKKIPHDNPSGHTDDLCRLVQTGGAEVLDVSRAGVSVGLVVFSIEGKELLVIAAFSSETGEDLTTELLPVVENLARYRGCISVRFHTVRAGLVVKSAALGYRVSEIVLRKNVL